jgi:uncharacterized membrane protein
MPQLISLVMVIYSYFLIRTSLPHLPPHIPMHFNAAGNADAWGSPETLWFLFAAQALTCAVFLLVPYLGQRAPSAVHLGQRRLSDFPPSQRARMVAILNDMMGYLSVVANLFFVLMLRQVIGAAEQPHPQLHMLWPLALFVGGTFGVMLYYWQKFNRAAKEQPPDDPGDGVLP